MSEFEELRRMAEAATPGSWSVFDMDDAEKRKGEPMNEPGRGWYWVWADDRRPYYGGVLETEKHHPDCGAAIGESRIDDGVGGKQEFADAQFIAAANPTAVLALVARVEAAEAKRDALADAIKRDQCGGCRGIGSHRRHCPRHPDYHPWRALADRAESIGDSIGVPELANRAWALAGAIRDAIPQHPPYRALTTPADQGDNAAGGGLMLDDATRQRLLKSTDTEATS